MASSLASTVQTSNALLVYLAGIIDRDPKWRACSHYSFSICETGNALLDYLIGIIGVSTKSSELQHYHYFIYYFHCSNHLRINKHNQIVHLGTFPKLNGEHSYIYTEM